MTAPSFVAVGAQNSGTTGAVTYAHPAGVATDDIEIAGLESAATAGVVTPAAWVDVAGSPRAQGSNTLAVNALIHRYTSGDIALVGAASGNHQAGAIAAFRGVDTTTPVDTTSNNSGNSATPVGLGITTTVDDCRVLLVAVWGADDATAQFSSVANSSLTGVTVHYQAGTINGNGGGVLIASGVKATAGTVAAWSANLAVSQTWATIVIALRPAPGTAPVTATRDTTWRAQAAAAATRASTWRVAAAIATLRSSSWNVRTVVAATRSSTWRALARPEATRSTSWDVRIPVTAQRSSTWNVDGTISQVTATRATTWRALAPSTGARATSWRTRAAAATLRTTTWDVRREVTKTTATSWDTRVTVTASRATSWDTPSTISRALATAWDVRRDVTAQRSSSWNVDSTMTSVVAQRAATWRTLARPTSTRSATWDTRALAANTRPTSWDVRTSTARDCSTTWRTLSAAASTRPSTWRTRTIITSVRVTTWQTQGDAAEPLVLVAGPRRPSPLTAARRASPLLAAGRARPAATTTAAPNPPGYTSGGHP